MSNFQTPRGCNPLLQTKRGKLQQKRSTLNEQISKQLRLRAGAENLLRATNDKKLREQIALELSFVDSNLQLLREELANLNTSVQIYQNDKCPRSMPLIPFGLRETKDVEFNVAFKDSIIEHYSEDFAKYDHSVEAFSELRKAIKTPSRDDDGVKLLFEYYNHLCCAERRFFAPGKHAGIYFEWFDSVTGVPAMQRSVAFEKGSVLFNISALYTQLAANEDRASAVGLEKAIEYFSRAAGVLYYLKENFSNSPSVDMRRDVLDALLSLLLAQVQECFFDLCLLRMDKKTGTHASLKLSEEAAQVSKLYSDTCRVTAVQSIKQYLPAPWLTLVAVKRDHYMALAHFFNAIALLATEGSSSSDATLSGKVETKNAESIIENRRIDTQTVAEKSLLARVHLKCAYALHDESSTESSMCKQLRQLSVLQNVLRKSQDRTQRLRRDIDGGGGGNGADEFDSYDLYENVEVQSQSIFEPTLIPPDFAVYKVVDLFRDLGPLSIFCARNQWTSPRQLQLRRTSKCPGYGFSVRGDAPVFVSSVESGGLANLSGLKVGDIIVAIDNRDTKWASHEDLVRQIRSSGDSLLLTIVSPSQASPSTSLHSLSTSPSSTCSSASSSPANASHDLSNISRHASSSPLTYSTLPSHFLHKKKPLPATPAPLAPSPSNGIFSFSTLKNLKQKRKSANSSANVSSTSSNFGDGNDSAGSTSFSLRNLIFSKKYSKSVDALNQLNNPRRL